MNRITRLAIANRWITFFVVLLIAAGSIWATFQLKTELIPDIELPYVAVMGMQSGISAEDMMTNIAIPVEEEFQKVSGLKHIESTSSEAQTSVFATFEYGTDMEKVEREIQSRLEEHTGADGQLDLKPLLDSEDLEEGLKVVRISIEMIPLMWVTVSSNSGLTGAEVREQALELEDMTRSGVKGLLEDETAFMKAVAVYGGEEDALVIPNVEAMNSRGIPVSWLMASLGDSSKHYGSLQEIESVPVLATGATIGEIATVHDPVPDSYTNGGASVSLLWYKAADSNTVDVANAVMAKIGEFRETHDAQGVKVDVVFDQSTMIEQSRDTLVRDAAIGVVLASIVVFVFLWALRASLIVCISIPLSVFVGFLLMWVFHVTINILTLGGMAIAVGRVVDDSIVSLENVYRHRQRGEPYRKAALDGVREVAMPVASATLATVAIFIPLMRVGGLVGELFIPFGLTVTFAMLASLTFALVLVPPLSSFLSPGKVQFEGGDNWYTRTYTKVLRWSLGHRSASARGTGEPRISRFVTGAWRFLIWDHRFHTLLIGFVLLVASVLMAGFLKTSFLNFGTGMNGITISVQMPYGNDSDTGDMIQQVEGKIRELDQQYGSVKNYYSFRGDPMGGMMGGSAQATILVELKGTASKEKQADAIQALCDELLTGRPYDKIVVTPGFAEEAMGGTNTLEVRVIGQPGTDDSILQSVKRVTTTLTGEVQELQAKGDIENLESPLTIDQNNAFKNEWYSTDLATYAAGLGILRTDPEYEAKMTQLGQQLEIEWANMRYGWPIVGAQLVQQSPTVDVGGTTTGIAVPGVVRSLTDINEITNLRIGAQSPTELRNLADVQMHPVSYMRAEGGYAGTITAKIVSSNVGAVNTDVQKMIDKLSLPSDVEEVKMGGVAEQMMEGFSEMGKAIGLAIIIVYIILLVFFRSWLTPLLIMFSLPLATIGVVVALLVSGYTLGMSAMIGVLMLVGIVLTNAIVLLTFVEDRRKEGYSTHDALMDAGRIRLRPILMTAITTMVALVPLSLGLGEGELIAAELGVVVIGGLFSSTVLTLIVIPVLYSLTERFRRKPKVKNDKPVEAL